MLRLGSRGLFLSGKGPKTIFTQVGTWNRSDASHGGTDQLARLKQGPLLDLSVSRVGRPADGTFSVFSSNRCLSCIRSERQDGFSIKNVENDGERNVGEFPDYANLRVRERITAQNSRPDFGQIEPI